MIEIWSTILRGYLLVLLKRLRRVWLLMIHVQVPYALHCLLTIWLLPSIVSVTIYTTLVTVVPLIILLLLSLNWIIFSSSLILIMMIGMNRICVIIDVVAQLIRVSCLLVGCLPSIITAISTMILSFILLDVGYLTLSVCFILLFLTPIATRPLIIYLMCSHRVTTSIWIKRLCAYLLLLVWLRCSIHTSSATWTWVFNITCIYFTWIIRRMLTQLTISKTASWII